MVRRSLESYRYYHTIFTMIRKRIFLTNLQLFLAFLLFFPFALSVILHFFQILPYMSNLHESCDKFSDAFASFC